MFDRLLGLIRWVLAEFGPLVAFWVLMLAFGIKIAIAGSLIFILGDSLWRWSREWHSPASMCSSAR